MECLNRLPSFGCFDWVSGAFWAKNACFWGTKYALLGGHIQTWLPCPEAPPVSFLLKTWIWQGHHLGSKMATWAKDPRRWEGAMAKMACRRVVACCCLLLLVS